MKFGLRLLLFGVVALAAIVVIGFVADSFKEVVLILLAGMIGLIFLTKVISGFL